MDYNSADFKKEFNDRFKAVKQHITFTNSPSALKKDSLKDIPINDPLDIKSANDIIVYKKGIALKKVFNSFNQQL